jgi:hypothetical protein
MEQPISATSALAIGRACTHPPAIGAGTSSGPSQHGTAGSGSAMIVGHPRRGGRSHIQNEGTDRGQYGRARFCSPGLDIHRDTSVVGILHPDTDVVLVEVVP